jgi:hypothetical protein
MRRAMVFTVLLAICLVGATGATAHAQGSSTLRLEKGSPGPATSGRSGVPSPVPQDAGAALLGHWTGEFPLANGNGKKYTVVIAYYVYADPHDPGKIRFKEADSLRFLDPSVSFSCSGTNFYSNSFEGEVVITGDTVKFQQKRVSNPDCGGLSVDVYRLDGDRLEAVRVDEGKITSGFLRRV